MLTEPVLRAIFGQWPHEQVPPKPHPFIASVSHAAELLEIPLPRATFLSPLFDFCLRAFYFLLALTVVRTIRNAPSQSARGGLPLGRLVEQRTYIATAVAVLWLAAFAAAQFLLVAFVAGVTGSRIAACVVPVLVVLWTLQQDVRFVSSGERPRWSAFRVYIIGTLVAFCLVPWLRQRIDIGIVQLFAWRVGKYNAHGPAWLRDMAREIIVEKRVPVYTESEAYRPFIHVSDVPRKSNWW
ncbi:hypothetical protein F4781DRAFT_445304 [Annulohypoxylon bovei var. microspora]|nr:hypothetical protein F4781DRAFT_445304 [Annulohypoxylon bovei var. microspora]